MITPRGKSDLSSCHPHFGLDSGEPWKTGEKLLLQTGLKFLSQVIVAGTLGQTEYHPFAHQAAGMV